VSVLLKFIPEDKCCPTPEEDHALGQPNPKKSANRMNSLSVRRFGQGASYNRNSGKLSDNHSEKEDLNKLL
jgi:hypothetical protein